MKLEAELEIPILFLVIFRGRHFEKALKGSGLDNFRCWNHPFS